MKKNSGKGTIAIVTELVEPIAKELELTVWDIQFVKEGAIWILRVVIDKEGGISVDDCEALSRPLDLKLDEVDPIEQSYCLEVSSAGLERELTKPWHYDKLTGQVVTVRLIRPYNGQRDFVGELLGLNSDSVSIKTDTDIFEFKLAEIAFTRLYLEF